MCSWFGWENQLSGFVQQGSDSASLDTAFAALRPRVDFLIQTRNTCTILIVLSDPCKNSRS